MFQLTPEKCAGWIWLEAGGEHRRVFVCGFFLHFLTLAKFAFFAFFGFFSFFTQRFFEFVGEKNFDNEEFP